MQTVKHSHQRDAIIANLRSRYDHPSADELYGDLKRELPALSLATLYRNLALLEQRGEILRLTCPSADRFDGNPKPHYHLLCESCSRLFDLELAHFDELDEIADAAFPGEVHSHILTFVGICQSCKDK